MLSIKMLLQVPSDQTMGPSIGLGLRNWADLILGVGLGGGDISGPSPPFQQCYLSSISIAQIIQGPSKKIQGWMKRDVIKI